MSNPRAMWKNLLRRVGLLALVTVVVVLAVSEIAYRLMRDPASRAPQTVTLVIPAGAAERVAAGEAPPGIPQEIIFVAGDTLLVENRDSAAHELGPLWIPSGANASLFLGEANDYIYACSFDADQSLDLTVRPATDWTLRLQALFFAGAPTFMFLLVYSFVLSPLKPSAAGK